MARRRSLTIASVNVNGIHAADRNGISAWIADRRPDVVTLQEVRAPDDIFTEHVDRLWGENGIASTPRAQQKAALSRMSAHTTLKLRELISGSPLNVSTTQGAGWKYLFLISLSL